MTEEYFDQLDIAGKTPEMIFQKLQEQQQADREGRVNYSQFRDESGESWEEIWDEGLTLAENLQRFIRESVILPSASLQVPIAVSYMMIPSAMANVCPILFCQGQKGTGKSSIGFIAAGLHFGTVEKVLGSSSTFASVRNILNQIRYHDESKEWERNCFLIWDDLKASTLADEKLYAMIRSGYNRASDLITIAGTNPGENLEFRTFSPKIVSSIEPFFAQHKFSELARRVIVIKFKKWEHFTLQEKLEAGLGDGFDIKDRFIPESANWDGFERKFSEFWNDTENLMHYQSIKKSLTKRGKKPFDIPESIEGENWTISIDLICSGVVSGVWDSLQSAVDHMGKYWEWYRANITSNLGATQKVLSAFIQEQTEQARLANEKLGYEAIPLRVSPELIKNHLAYAFSKGWLDSGTRPQDIAASMNDLGWKQELIEGQVYWVPMSA